RYGIRSGSVATFDVEPGETYEIQIRVISAFGTPSLWSVPPVEHEVLPIDQLPPPPDTIEVTPGPDAITITLGVISLDNRDINRVQVRVGTTDDRDTATAFFFPVPTNFEDIQTVEVFVPRSGPAATLYVWARFE